MTHYTFLKRLPAYAFLLLFSASSLAQQSPAKIDSPKNTVASSPITKTNFADIPVTPPVKGDPNLGKFSTISESLRTILVLVFGVITLVIASLLINKHAQDINSLFKYFIIILVIIGAIVLISIGYDKDQIAPTIGLFGTIAGYLLGKSDQQPNRNPTSPNPNSGSNSNPNPNP